MLKRNMLLVAALSSAMVAVPLTAFARSGHGGGGHSGGSSGGHRGGSHGGGWSSGSHGPTSQRFSAPPSRHFTIAPRRHAAHPRRFVPGPVYYYPTYTPCYYYRFDPYLYRQCMFDYGYWW
jgi:hypothetical protein